MEFRAELEQAGRTATGITVPDEVILGLGGGKRPSVLVTVNGATFATTVGSMGGQYKIPVSAERRALAGVAAGDVVDVTVVLETGPREVAVPDDLAAALAALPTVRAFFDGLAPGQRRAFVTPIAGAKTPETRQRRIGKAVAALTEGKKRV
ncbi:MAG TPA: YdeI/OmpD-associated family protein [Acidimicrobiales bacterium]